MKTKYLLIVIFVFMVSFITIKGLSTHPKVMALDVKEAAVILTRVAPKITIEPIQEPTLLPTKPIDTETATPKYQGPLSESERELVYTSSQKALADNHPDAIKISKSLGAQHPSNVCGPLSASFLIDAGIIKKSYIVNVNAPDTIEDAHPVDFWVFNPSPIKDAWKMDTWFPKNEFDRFYFSEPVGSFDFVKFPLYTGDFLYLWASDPNANFDHIMAVTRVDSDDRAYSVTNLRIGDWIDNKGEFVIKEVMLYDPSKPGIGQFANYNNFELRKFGLTGYKFMVIRRK